MEGPVNDQETKPESQDGPELRRKHRSMENVADPALVITTARSRLRSVAPEKAHVEGTSRSRAYTLAELGHMLDDAIEDSAHRPEIRSRARTGNLTPKPGFVLRRKTSHKSRHQSQSRGRAPRRSTESVAPRSSEESARVDYEDSENTQGPSRPDADSKETDISSTSLPDQGLAPLPQRGAELSPVKQRAAMFESLVRKPTGHDQICQHFHHNNDTSPQRQEPGGKVTRKIHRIKFGETIEERPGTPLIPLTLPQIVTQQKSRPASVLRTEQEDYSQLEPVGEQASIEDVFGTRRKTSTNWPFKWSIFNKSPTAPPQETEPQLAGDDGKDEHYPSTKPSVVRSIVQDLLQAANEKNDAEKRRRHSDRERMSRRQSRGPVPARQTDLKEDDKPPHLPPLHLAVQEQEEGLKPSAVADGNPAEPETPLHRAMTEKQVLSPPMLPEATNDSASGSPQKFTPRTPARGRGRSFHRLSTSDQQHAVEQHFNLSPGPSRSGSKNRGVKVEVEVRDSPEREARERGDKIVIIRANVASMDEGGG